MRASALSRRGDHPGPTRRLLGRLATLTRRKPQRTVDCAVCGRTIPVNKAVIVHGQITRDRDAYATTIAEYCKAHAPGQPRSLP